MSDKAIVTVTNQQEPKRFGDLPEGTFFQEPTARKAVFMKVKCLDQGITGESHQNAVNISGKPRGWTCFFKEDAMIQVLYINEIKVMMA